MPLGAFAPLPIRLGGTDTEGWSFRKHARMAADLVAVKRASPLAVWTYTKSGSTITIHSYFGQNGSGIAYAPDIVTDLGAGYTSFRWSGRVFEDPYEVVYPLNIKGARATGHGTTSIRAVVEPVANGVDVTTFDYVDLDLDGNLEVDAKVTVVVY